MSTCLPCLPVYREKKCSVSIIKAGHDTSASASQVPVAEGQVQAVPDTGYASFGIPSHPRVYQPVATSLRARTLTSSLLSGTL